MLNTKNVLSLIHKGSKEQLNARQWRKREATQSGEYSKNEVHTDQSTQWRIIAYKNPCAAKSQA